MFTGIILETGKINNLIKTQNSYKLFIKGDQVLKNLKIGDSISVNGICLTVVSFNKFEFEVDVMNETLEKTSLKNLNKNFIVNLEKAVSANDFFNGHFVSGHIDGVGKISKIINDSNSKWFYVKTTKEILKYIIYKGSIAIDGISLTVAKVDKNLNEFCVSIIPHTLKVTNLKNKKINDIVNLENDIFAKYVENFMNLRLIGKK